MPTMDVTIKKITTTGITGVKSIGVNTTRRKNIRSVRKNTGSVIKIISTGIPVLWYKGEGA